MFLKIITSLLILLASFSGWADFPYFFSIEKEAGVGEWKELPFGQARIISCSTGVKGLSIVIGGMQVRLADGWTMKKPVLKPLSEELFFWGEAPVRPGDGRNTLYKEEVFFPLIYGRDVRNPDDFEFGVQGEFPVCQGDKCMVLPIRMGLFLTPNEAKYTSACPYITEKQIQAPFIKGMHKITGQAVVQGEHVQMAFFDDFGRAFTTNLSDNINVVPYGRGFDKLRESDTDSVTIMDNFELGFAENHLLESSGLISTQSKNRES